MEYQLERLPDGPGFGGRGEFEFFAEWAAFRPDEPGNVRWLGAYPEEVQEYIDQHPGYVMRIRYRPQTTEWEDV